MTRTMACGEEGCLRRTVYAVGDDALPEQRACIQHLHVAVDRMLERTGFGSVFVWRYQGAPRVQAGVEFPEDD